MKMNMGKDTLIIINELPTLPFQQYKIDKSLESYVNDIKEERGLAGGCIRIGSNIIIATVVYFLDVLFNEKIPKFDINQMEAIS